jgi:hypothetical protein
MGCLTLGAACGKAAASKEKLSAAVLGKLVGHLREGQSFASAVAKVEEVMGPAKEKTEGVWTYAVEEGAACYWVTLEKEGDKLHDAWEWVYDYARGDHERCTALAKGQR